MGSISIYRPHNECGKNSPMDITITGTDGNVIKRQVADGETETIEVSDGVYRVYVKHGVESNKVDVEIKGNQVSLTAEVIPKQLAVIEEIKLG